jgi:uncharacterized membrane protein YgdD (TMEM256/DUF423 family)
MTSGNPWVLFAALSGGTGVMLGAFGAHALRSRLTEAALATWHIGVTYQLTHALALLAVGVLALQPWARDAGAERLLTGVGIAFVAGIIFFSGSLYALALGGPRWLGPITPLGGLSFIAGWLLLGVAALRTTSGG